MSDRVNEAGVPAPSYRRRNSWSERDKAAFLDALAVTGNITQAARAVQRTGYAAHHMRRRDEAFAAAWRVALDAACEMLQAAVIEHALGGSEADIHWGDDRDRISGVAGTGVAGTGEAAVCPACGRGFGRQFDPELALKVLNSRAARDARPKAAPMSNYRLVPIEEVEASLMKKIAAIVRARKTAGRGPA